MSEKEVIVIGAGGHCRAVIDCLQSSKRLIKGILDLEYGNEREIIMGICVLGSYSELIASVNTGEVELVVALGDNHQRQTVYNDIVERGFNVPTFIHRTALVSSSVSIDKGCFVGAGSIINALATIKPNSIINTGAIIEHETEIGANCHIGPGVKIAGRVKVGAYTFIGIGASVIDKVVIGEKVVIGAGSVVIADIESNRRVAGAPARVFA